jgi:hypothetical protein
VHHEDREEHEVQEYKINRSFVAFVYFVVTKSMRQWQILHMEI